MLITVRSERHNKPSSRWQVPFLVANFLYVIVLQGKNLEFINFLKVSIFLFFLLTHDFETAV